MSGLRTGYIVTRDAVLHDRIPKLLRCTINGVNSLAQWAALAAVTGSDRAHRRHARGVSRASRHDASRAHRNSAACAPFAPRGAFYVWVELDPSVYERLEVADADALATLLADQGIGSAPGDAFGERAPTRSASPSAATRRWCARAA